MPKSTALSEDSHMQYHQRTQWTITDIESTMAVKCIEEEDARDKQKTKEIEGGIERKNGTFPSVSAAGWEGGRQSCCWLWM